MRNPISSRKRPDAAPQGRTIPAQGETTTTEKVPRLPHEHDESSDSQRDNSPSQHLVGAQAHDDVERGLVDTDRGPVADLTYNTKVKPGAAPAVFRPAGPSASRR